MEDQISSTENRNFKFKELKVYSSTEWLADNRKKYRQVFEKSETSYIYTELSFYNKLFDRDHWDVDIELRCFDVKSSKKKVCNLTFRKKISKHDNIVFIREGWGNKKEGTFWKKGTYYWEAWIDGVLTGSKYFYVEDFASVLQHDANPHPVKLKTLRLYEGQYDDVIEEERNYLMTFPSEQTRYVYTEIHLVNKVKTENWHCELFVKFYNQARELKGQVTRLTHIKKDEDFIKVTAGWGANTKGSWKPGWYTVEVIFMDYLLASVEFEVGDDAISGFPFVKTSESGFINGPDIGDEHETFEDVYQRLDQLIGLQQLKRQVKDHAKYLEFINLRRQKGFEELNTLNLHSVFKGNPGTGKTTVAKLMGHIYKKMGLLSKGHVVEVDRVDLVGEYIGQTAPKTKEAIERAKGGVLFIDEAYALARANDDAKDFGKEAVEILIKELSSGKGDMAVIVAGYPKEMDYFLNSNPGLKSRFTHQFDFQDYTPQELLEIALLKAERMEVFFSENSLKLLKEIITRAYRERSISFGNARYIQDLLDKVKINLGLRIMNRKSPKRLTKAQLSEVVEADVLPLKSKMIQKLPEIPVDEELLSAAMDELEALIGIDNVKQQIKEMVSIVRYHNAIGKNVLSVFSLHTVLIGNPGTGKTTVARILAKLYKALGLLERGHIVETDRQGLVAGFVGQTAIKTAEKIDQALDGVLFIDEAYALSNFNGSQGDFGHEVIQTLLKKMEDYRGRLFVIVAGYPDQMDVFLKANPGLSSRFDKTYAFEDYTTTQLMEIAVQMLLSEGYKCDPKSKSALVQALTEMYDKKEKYFGNARAVRKLVLDIIKYQNLRIAEGLTKSENPKPNIINSNDVILAQKALITIKPNKSSIGYK